MVSLALDGELSELEHRLLAAHVGGCVRCGEYARSVSAATSALRAAPLELPGNVVHVARLRRTGVRVVQVAAAAAAVAVAVGLGSLAGSLTSGDTGGSVAKLAEAQTQQPYVEQHLLAMLRTASERSANHGAIPS